MSHPEVNAAECVGCESCISSCPNDLFEMVDGVSKFKIAQKDECVQCESCVSACGAGAIKMVD